CYSRDSKGNITRPHVVFNDERETHDTDHSATILKGGSLYQTGALKRIFLVDSVVSTPPFDANLLLQESSELKPGGIDLFASKIKEGYDAVAWLTFPFFWDSKEQEEWARKQVGDEVSSGEGIFGSMFMITKEGIEKLLEQDLFPRTATCKLE